ncbi:hypothetical protein FRC07_002564 [Ceratobasidium sp. 392]|nr:hypothetical protein FRC07_002564 [Ceratobasidium sp. 392]
MSKHDMNAGIPTIFRSYKVAANRIPDCTIWEAICASMAHPAHFKSIDIGEAPMRQSFVTSSLGCSNPTAHVLEEVKRVYPDRHVSCIIVVGAGHTKTIHIPEPSPLQRMQLAPTDANAVAMSVAMDTERVAHEITMRFRSTTDVYFRLNVEQGMQTIGLDSWDQLGKVVVHTRAYMRHAEVNANIDKIVKAIRERAPAIETAYIDGEIRLPSQRKGGIKDCPDPTPVFTGRTDMIERIERCIINGDKQRCVFVLHGLGGAGKTQAALRTVQKTRDVWSDIVFVDATTQDTAVSALVGFAKAKKIGDAHTDTIKWLSACRERWLMVFDNADDPSLDIRGFFPPGDHGSILVTTRISQLALLAQGPEPECSVLSMHPGEALELFLKTARLQDAELSETERNAAVTLLQEFGHLALAIVHSGAYIWCSQRTVSQYYDMFVAQRQATLDKYQEILTKVDSYQRSVYTTWYLSYKLLSGRAQQLLWLMAYMHHDGIIEELFRRAALRVQTYKFVIPPSDGENEVYVYIKGALQSYLNPDGSWNSGAFLTVMTEVMSYSLITYDRVNDAYTLHVLVHDWISTVVPHARAVALEHTTFILAVSVDYELRVADYIYKRGLEPHVNAVLLPQLGGKPNANNAALLAEVYFCVSKWSQKESLDQLVLEARKCALGNEDPHTLASMFQLAATYRQLGRYNEAGALQLQELKASKRVSGDDHPDTLTSMHNLAITYQYLGRYKEAEMLQLQELEASKRVSGSDHPDTLTSMHYLAVTYQYLGRYNEAEALQLQVLETRKRVCGDDHPHTLASMRNLAATYRQLGRYKEAEILRLQVLEDSKRVSGDDHPSTLASMRNLADTYQDLGRYKEAEALQLQVLEARKRVSGDDHPDTLVVMYDLTVTYRFLGRYKEAEALQLQELEASKRVSGDDHPSTLTSMASTMRLRIWQFGS